MGIKIKHLDHYIFNGSLYGNAAITSVAHIVAPFDGVIIDHMMVCGAAGITGSQVSDCKINNVSIYATAGNRPTITTGTSSQKNTAAVIDGVRTFSKGDLLSLTIAIVHSGTLAVDTALRAILKRRNTGTVAAYEE